MTEPDVALTDYALALECGVFAHLLLRGHQRDPELRRWFALFFGSVSVASLLGGSVHGFFQDGGTLAEALLWRATLLAIGVSSLAGWTIGALLQCSRRVARWIRRAATAQLALYAVLVVSVTREFWLAIVVYVPAAVFLLVCLGLAYRRSRAASLAWGALGLALTLVAAAIQQLRVALHPVYFNHNALYHAVQGVALFLVFVGARGIRRSAC